MADRISRSAAGWAALVALPVALVVGLAVFAGLGGFADGRAAPPSPTSGHATASPAATASPPGPTSTTSPTGPPTGTATAGGPVPVAVPELAPPAAAVCRRLVDRLPPALRDRARRPVTAGAKASAAAYGDPPITLTCGVPAPTIQPTDFLPTLDAVCWHVAEAPGATVWTTADRAVPVRVTVPAAYAPPGQWVIDFSAPVAATQPRAAKAPSGCP